MQFRSLGGKLNIILIFFSSENFNPFIDSLSFFFFLATEGLEAEAP